MKLRPRYTQRIAAAKSGFSQSTVSQLDRDLRSPSQKKLERRYGGGRPDPLGDLWDQEIVPLLEVTPQIQPVMVLNEMKSRYPDRNWDSIWRTLTRRIRTWKTLHGPDKEVTISTKARKTR